MRKSSPSLTNPLPVSSAAGLTLPVVLASECLKWASDDPTRIHIGGIGIALLRGQPVACATNGHLAVTIPITGTDLGPNQSWFPREYVEREIALAKAVKSPTVTLVWDKVDGSSLGKYPPIDQVIPEPKRVKGETLVVIRPIYYACSASVGAAFAKAMGLKPDNTEIGVVTRAVGGRLDPHRTDVIGRSGVLATVVVMPMRADTPWDAFKCSKCDGSLPTASSHCCYGADTVATAKPLDEDTVAA